MAREENGLLKHQHRIKKLSKVCILVMTIAWFNKILQWMQANLEWVELQWVEQRIILPMLHQSKKDTQNLISQVML